MLTRRTGLKSGADKQRGVPKKQPEASLSPVPQLLDANKRSEATRNEPSLIELSELSFHSCRLEKVGDCCWLVLEAF